MSASPETRLSLLVRIRDHEDRAAWSEFVEVYAPLIQAYVCHRGIQEADAADLTQEVLRTVAEKKQQFQRDREGSFRSWLFTVTLNKIRNWYRKHQRDVRGSGDSALARCLQELPDKPVEDEAWINEHRWRLFMWAAEKARVDFRPDTFDVFWQTAVDNQAPSQIAERMNMSVGAVHIAKSRVLARIRELVSTLEGEV